MTMRPNVLAAGTTALWVGRRLGRLPALILWAGAGLGVLPGPAPAAPPEVARARWDILRQAEDHYREGRLPQAETLYLRALSRAEGEDRRHCYKRLLEIYEHAARLDRAIRVGLEYESWLQATGRQPQAREVAVSVGGWYLTLGHHTEAERHLRRGLDDRKGAPLAPYWRATGLAHLGLAAERQGDHEQADRAWWEVEVFAKGQLARPPRELTPTDRIACARGLAECYRFRRKWEKAVPLLEALLPEHDKVSDWTGKRDTLRVLAGHLAATRKVAEAQKRLREALRLHEEHAPHDRLIHGDLVCELADTLERGDQPAAAERERQKAVSDYRAVWKEFWEEQRSRAGALAVFWRLQALYQRTLGYQKALDLTEEAAEKWGGTLLESRLKAERGRLIAILKPGARDRGEARELLGDAVKDLEGQSPANLVEFARALLTLGVLELEGGSRAKAEELGRRSQKLYEEHRLPGDLVLVETYDLLGSCAALGGNYADAIEQYQQGAKQCDLLGKVADPQSCGLRLNLAVLYKAQGEVDKALRECQEARAAFARFAGPGSPGLAAFDAAQASMLTTKFDFEKANALAKGVLKVCKNHDLPGKSLLKTSALHCQALYHLSRGDFADAEKGWELVRKIQEEEGSPALPRTLNYLALAAECKKEFAEAEILYQDALRRQEAGPPALPVTQFTTLWRLAELADRRKAKQEARDLLGRAVQVVERARPRIYGEAPERANYFAQFAPAFERLVEWSVRDGDVESAICAAALGRSRSLMDQLLLAGVDPRKTLPADKRHLLREEAELKEKLADLRARVQLSPDKAEGLLKEIKEAEGMYIEAYGQVLKASRAYQGLAQRDFTRKELQGLRDRVIGPKGMLLVYHVGRERSFLLLLDGRSRQTKAFPLTVPAELDKRVGPLPELLVLNEAGPRRRGLRLRGHLEQPELPEWREERVVPLGESVLRDLVDSYLLQVAEPTFSPSRGLRLGVRPKAQPLPPQRPELLANVVLPPQAREWVLRARPECVTVVPDGALHKLPLESLVLKGGTSPRYVLDEFPPLVYAPSVAALTLLADRRSPFRHRPLSLLTVANPAYPASKGAARAAASSRLTSLPELPVTKEESEWISLLFEPGQVTKLHREQATKDAVLQALKRDRRRIVHLAVHGIPDEDFGGRSAALAFSPTLTRKGTGGDIGWLYLHEIYTLPLEGCELAVLSACETNVGPQPPLEAGVTLAGGFLTAGARRVVASQWEVGDDESTARLMETFFREVVAANRRGGPVPFALALQKARKEVRNRSEWSAPFHWAPFVLIGPAE
jgi:tetratricopeptide (TPR) repeat protein